VNQVIIVPGTGFAPQCPGYGVENCRFAIAVIAAKAGYAYAFERQRWYIVSVAHEVFERQSDRNHVSV
jgi:hypothetical protein